MKSSLPLTILLLAALAWSAAGRQRSLPSMEELPPEPTEAPVVTGPPSSAFLEPAIGLRWWAAGSVVNVDDGLAFVGKQSGQRFGAATALQANGLATGAGGVVGGATIDTVTSQYYALVAFGDSTATNAVNVGLVQGTLFLQGLGTGWSIPFGFDDFRRIGWVSADGFGSFWRSAQSGEELTVQDGWPVSNGFIGLLPIVAFPQAGTLNSWPTTVDCVRLWVNQSGSNATSSFINPDLSGSAPSTVRHFLSSGSLSFSREITLVPSSSGTIQLSQSGGSSPLIRLSGWTDDLRRDS